MDTTVKESILNVLADRKYDRNLRGKLTTALSYLPKDLQKHLVLEYAAHISWIFRETLPDRNLDLTLETIRLFLDRKASLDELSRGHSILFVLLRELQASKSHTLQAVEPSVWTFILVLNACCQRELEKAKIIAYTKHETDAKAVAFEASRAVAAYKAATSDLDDEDNLKHIKREASEQETQWQLSRLVQFVEAQINANNSPENSA